ncbi:MAG: DUF4418 family protein [Treponema sp.]|nr:DUF4418 family protein [Treponema sp.]
MKKANVFFGLIFVVLGVLVAAAPYSFAHVCEVGEKVMKCHWTARVELFLGISVAVFGIAKALLSNSAFNLGTNLGLAVNGAGVILVPSVLIGVCGMKKMHCAAVAKPALIVFGILIIAVAVVQSVYLWKKR